MVTDFKKNKKRNFWGSLLMYAGGVLLVCFLALLIFANIKMYQKKQEFLAQVSNLKNQIKDIEKKNQQLNQGILSADNDQYIEKIAREQLDLQKKGEKVVSFVMPKPEQPKNDNSNNTVQGWFAASLEWIKSKF